MSDVLVPFENAGWPVILIGETGGILNANRAARALMEQGKASFAEALRANWGPRNIISLPAFQDSVAKGDLKISSVLLRNPNGEEATFLPVLLVLEGTRLLQFVPESGATRKAQPESPIESTTAHKQKLDCALQLTRTVALDFNNALTSILGHTSLVLAKMENNHPWRSSLVEVEKSAEKAAEIAYDLAAFSRVDKDPRTQLIGNLNDLVRRTADLFAAPAGKKITWELKLETRLYGTHFDEAKIQQAFAKILDNSVQSLGEQGTLVAHTFNIEFEQPHSEGTTKIPAGTYVCVQFTDNGAGIPRDILPRIFEPFFTTKNSTQHRGLGLAWVYGIITNHGGFVTVKSEVGHGTTVSLYLPAMRRVIKDKPIRSDDLTGTQTILMIDDETLLLTMGEMVLSSFGYKVLTADSGLKGLELFAKSPDKIDLVITDLVMPQMSGRELIDRLKGISPNVRIICASGFMRASSSEEDEFYLQKPFTSQQLLQKVKQVLAPVEILN